MKQSEGTYFQTNGNSVVAIVLIDGCKNPKFLQAGFLSAIPHILIADNPVYHNSLASPIAHIFEFQSGAKSLKNEIEKCVASFEEQKPSNPFACVIPAALAPSDDFVLSRSDKAIFVNDIEIMSKQAKMQFDVFNIWIDAFIDDFKNSTVTYVDIYQMADKLRDLGYDMDDAEKKTRRIIQNIKISLDRKNIIFEKIIDHFYGSGYKLNYKNARLKNCQT